MIDRNPRLIIGHGTRNDEGARQFLRLVDRLQEVEPDRRVAGCFLELRPPSIADVWQQFVDAGAREVHALPLLLFSAGHAKRDLPEALDACVAKSPGVTYRFGRPLSRHPELVSRACDLAESTFPRHRERKRTLLLIIGRGSYDPCAQSDTKLLSECVFRLARQRAAAAGQTPPIGVETAFYAMAKPSLDEVLTRLQDRSDFDHLAVQPHLLFAGQLHAAIVGKVRTAAAAAFWSAAVAAPLGPDRRIVAAVQARLGELDRYREPRTALAGSVHT